MFQLLVEIYMIGLCCQNFDIIKNIYTMCTRFFFKRLTSDIELCNLDPPLFYPQFVPNFLMPLSMSAIFETQVLWVI